MAAGRQGAGVTATRPKPPVTRGRSITQGGPHLQRAQLHQCRPQRCCWPLPARLDLRRTYYTVRTCEMAFT